MSHYLIFQLYGPMSAWGDIAVGEYRPTFAYPTKSAILGMISAALGLRREDDEKHLQLAASYYYGVRVDSAGQLLRDYHTSQVPSARKGVVHATRCAELAADRRTFNTILSSRDYRCDACYTAALWCPVASPPYTLYELKTALENPLFTLYLGRKSCPPALPLQAKIIGAASLKEAFDHFGVFPDDEIMAGFSVSRQIHYYWEGGAEGFESEQILRRRDMPVSRKRRQFADREEHCASIGGQEEGMIDVFQ